MNVINPAVIILVLVCCAIVGGACYYFGMRKRVNGAGRGQEETGSEASGGAIASEGSQGSGEGFARMLYMLKKFLISPLGKIVMIAALYAPLIGLFLVILELFDQVAPFLVVVVAIVFSYFGWQALSRITPNIFLIMPIGGWIAYFFVKGMLSFFLGTVIAPIIIGNRIVQALARELSQSLEENPPPSAKSSGTAKPSCSSSAPQAPVNLSEFDKMMASLPTMNEDTLRTMHRDLLFYMRERPVPFPGRDYLADLLEFQRKLIAGGPVYGCTTYGEAEKLNEAIVKYLDAIAE